MMIIDESYSEEGGLLSHYGPENGYWKWSDEAHTKRETMPLEDGQAPGQLRGKCTPAVGTNIPK